MLVSLISILLYYELSAFRSFILRIQNHQYSDRTTKKMGIEGEE